MSTQNITMESFTVSGKSKILSSIRGLYISKILKVAVKIDLFNLLSEKPLMAKEIQNCLGLNGRGLNDFLDVLVSVGVLQRNRDGSDGCYSNTDEVSLFLVKGSPYYIGWSFDQRMVELEQLWGSLEEALKTGKPQRRDIKESGKSLFDLTYSTDEKSRSFVQGMNFGQMGSFKDFVYRFDFSRYQTLCDIGGSNGLLSILAALQHPHLKCITFDLPALEPFAREKIESAGLTRRIIIHSGDFFKDDFPQADVITMGNILHDWNLEQKKQLMSKAYQALPEGGIFVSIESYIDDERRKNTTGLLMSLHMLLLTEGGFDCSVSDFKRWALEVGFKQAELFALSGDSNAMIAYK